MGSHDEFVESETGEGWEAERRGDRSDLGADEGKVAQF